MGAKNHCVVLPDANKNKTISQITGAAFGAAGQRCMALSVAIFVGKSKEWIGELVEAAKRLKVNAGHVPGTDLGPVISPQSKQRICDLIESGVKEGVGLPLDGRGIVVPGYERGNFIGPTILTGVKVYFDPSVFLFFFCLLIRSLNLSVCLLHTFYIRIYFLASFSMNLNNLLKQNVPINVTKIYLITFKRLAVSV